LLAILVLMLRVLLSMLLLALGLAICACGPGGDGPVPGDDDDSSGGDGFITVHGGVEIITVGEYRPAGDIRIYEDGGSGAETYTETEEGDWYLQLPADQQQAMVRGARDDLTEVSFFLDLRWQRDRVDHLVLFNPFVADERDAFFVEEFGFPFDPQRGLLHVGAVSRTQGTEFAGATVEMGLDYEASFAVDDELGPATTTDTQGILAFLNVEVGETEIIVRDPQGQLCVGVNPVPVEAGITSHVVYECP
tara:strand:- start:246 stop:992 length:747 start_codon:yes stop_codon:yes gene_type:complete